MASRKSNKNTPASPVDPIVISAFDAEGKTSLGVIPVSQIDQRPGDNPNVVSDDQFAMLVAGIRANGFLQPVTVREVNGRYELIDGHHRLRAAKEIGLAVVPCLITTATDLEATAEMLALNRLRGELDLAQSAKALKLLADAGFPDLTLTGFGQQEIDTLLATIQSSTDGLDHVGEDAGAGGDQPEAVHPQSRFSVRLLFDKQEDRDLLKAVALRFGPTIESGLLALAKAQPEG